MTKKIATLLITGLVLAACSTSTSTSDLRKASNSSEPTPIQSSGNADQDVQKVEAELDSLDIETDFPSLSQDDLEK